MFCVAMGSLGGGWAGHLGTGIDDTTEFGKASAAWESFHHPHLPPNQEFLRSVSHGKGLGR